MSEPERPFLPMSWELGGDFMSGMADSIRERGAREVPAPTEEGVAKETFDEWEEDEEWEEEDEWEDEEWEEEEWEESLTEKALNTIEALMPRLVGFAIDVATMAIPAMLMLLAIVLFQKTTFEIFETAMLVGGATLITMFVSDAKQKLLQRLKQPKF